VSDASVRCALCRFFVTHNNAIPREKLVEFDEGECRRHGPATRLTQAPFNTPQAVFPIIRAFKFCGEFERVDDS
jgi:hypothetical protein